MTDPAGTEDTMRDTPHTGGLGRYESDDEFFEGMTEAIANTSMNEEATRLKAQMAHGMVNVLVRELRRIADALDELVRQGREKARLMRGATD